MPDEKEYSQQSAEILGKMPPWIVRWGITVIFIIFGGLIVGSCLMKFPQIVTAPIVITTINPPADLIAKTTGRIDTIFAADGTMLQRNNVVAMLQNTADFDDIQAVATRIEFFSKDSLNKWMSNEYKMGELQGTFSDFRQKWLTYKQYREADNLIKKIASIRHQISKYQLYLSQLKAQYKLQKEDYGYTIINHKRDSQLYVQNVISALDYERSTQAKVQKESSIVGFEASLTTTELTVIQLEQQVIELNLQLDTELINYINQINESRNQLLAQINQWRQNYLLIAPVNGTLSFTKYWSNNQNVTTGDKIATIIPQDSSEVVGIMDVPSAGFGRVTVGQTVNVKLNGFPYFEYGLLKGEINRISSIPGKEGYVVEVVFPNGLQSTYKEQLTLIQQMDGTGDIITKDQRLIERFIQPIRAFFDR